MATAVAGLSLAAGMTGVGLSTGEITTALKVHKEAYQQDKRFFYASYTEAVAHHGEAYAQSERIHAQSYAHAEAQYWQADKHHRRTFQQAKLQHRVAIDLAMRAEIREGLRDEFGQKNNRYNALMICQTVMLTCSFQLSLIEPAETAWRVATYLYTSTLGMSIGLLTLSLWCNFILTRRLNQYTAGVMQIEMHQNEAWRRKMGQDDVVDAQLIREEFRKWFKRHCSWFGSVSMHMFSAGVCSLFVSVAILLQNRLGLDKISEPFASVPFWSMLAFAVGGIIVMEVRERSHQKKKRGVYRQTWKGQQGKNSSLRRQMEELRDFESPTTVQTEEDAMIMSSAEENRARNRCPLVNKVVETASLSAKAGKTQALLEKAWKMFQENEQDEKERKSEDWTRDDAICGILTEVRELAEARRDAHLDTHHGGNFGRAPGAIGEDDDDDDGASSLYGNGDEMLDDEDDNSTMRLSASGVSGVSRGKSTRQLSKVDTADVDELNASLGKYFRSTLVRISNATDKPLHIRSKKIPAGRWMEECAPPTIIEPMHEAIFASTSRYNMFGGTEAEVVYDTRDSDWAFTMKWANPVVAGERGRYCDATVRHQGKEISASEAANAASKTIYYIIKDDDDQEENSQVFFTVTSSRDAQRARDMGHAYQNHRTGSSVKKVEEIKADFLRKKRPDIGLALPWQKRWFVLTRTRLRYFRSPADTRAQAQLGEVSLADVIAGYEESQTEFVVVVSNSQREPYTLKASSAAEKESWMSLIKQHMPSHAKRKSQPPHPVRPPRAAERSVQWTDGEESDGGLGGVAAGAATQRINLPKQGLHHPPTRELITTRHGPEGGGQR